MNKQRRLINIITSILFISFFLRCGRNNDDRKPKTQNEKETVREFDLGKDGTLHLEYTEHNDPKTVNQFFMKITIFTEEKKDFGNRNKKVYRFILNATNIMYVEQKNDYKFNSNNTNYVKQNLIIYLKNNNNIIIKKEEVLHVSKIPHLQALFLVFENQMKAYNIKKLKINP